MNMRSPAHVFGLEGRLGPARSIRESIASNGFALQLISQLKSGFGNDDRYHVEARLPEEFIVRPTKVTSIGEKAHTLHLRMSEFDKRDTRAIYGLIGPVIRQDPDYTHYFRIFFKQPEDRVY